MGKVSEWMLDHLDVVLPLVLISIFVFGMVYAFTYFSSSTVFERCYDLIDKKEIYGSWNSTEKDYMYENCTRYL